MLNNICASALLLCFVFGKSVQQWERANGSSLLEFYVSREKVNWSAANHVCEDNGTLANFTEASKLDYEKIVDDNYYWIENENMTRNEDCTALNVNKYKWRTIALPCSNLAGYICQREIIHSYTTWGIWGSWSECHPTGEQFTKRTLVQETREYMLHYRPCLYDNATNSTAAPKQISTEPVITTFSSASTFKSESTERLDSASTNNNYWTSGAYSSHGSVHEEWKFDSSSFFLAFPLFLPIVFLIAIKHWRLLKQFEYANNELDYIKEGRRRTSEERKRQLFKEQKDESTQNQDEHEECTRPPHYENLVEGNEEAPAYGNSVFSRQMSENKPHYQNVSQTSDVISEDEDEYVVPNSVPGVSMQYDGYENLNTNTPNDLTVTIEKSRSDHQFNSPASRPKLKSLMETKMALKPVLEIQTATADKKTKPGKQTIAMLPPTDPKRAFIAKNNVGNLDNTKVSLKPGGKKMAQGSGREASGAQKSPVGTYGVKSANSVFMSGDHSILPTKQKTFSRVLPSS